MASISHLLQSALLVALDTLLLIAQVRKHNIRQINIQQSPPSSSKCKLLHIICLIFQPVAFMSFHISSDHCSHMAGDTGVGESSTNETTTGRGNGNF